MEDLEWKTRNMVVSERVIHIAIREVLLYVMQDSLTKNETYYGVMTNE